MDGWGFQVTGVRWWCAAAASALLPGPLLAQTMPAPTPVPAPPPPDAAELDPNASVEPRTEKAGDALSVVLTVDPGAQYRFASVNLPGLDAAGPDAARLRDTFGVKPGDPVVAVDVIAAGLALTTALGEQGYAEAKFGEQDIEVNHLTHLATLSLRVNPGPVARFGS